MPNSQEITVFNRKTGKLFRDGAEPVYILEDGRFVVKREGDWLAFKTLANIDKTKRAMSKDPPVKLMLFRYDHEMEIRDVVEWLDNGKFIEANGNVIKYPGSGWRLYDQKTAERRNKIMARKKKLERQIEKIGEDFDESLGQTLTQESFRAAQLELIDRLKESSKQRSPATKGNSDDH